MFGVVVEKIEVYLILPFVIRLQIFTKVVFQLVRHHIPKGVLHGCAAGVYLFHKFGRTTTKLIIISIKVQRPVSL